MQHKSVLNKEAIELLELREGFTVVDGTLGAGGHSAGILEKIGPSGSLIAIDQDPKAIEHAKERFKAYENIQFVHDNFRNFENILDSLNVTEVDAVMLDIGFSSDQLADETRGFSFDLDGPLDMRMNPESNAIPAWKYIQDLSQEELADVFWKYGEERHSRRFAGAIVQYRKTKPIQTSGDLVEAAFQALPERLRAPVGRRPSFARKNPTTKLFQALRILVNDELGAIEDALPAIWSRLKPDGRLAVISFHSLEDRIVKNFIRDKRNLREGTKITSKPVVPSREEVLENSRSRSAKLRVVKKGYEGKRKNYS